jgi:hypothetical protein
MKDIMKLVYYEGMELTYGINRYTTIASGNLDEGEDEWTYQGRQLEITHRLDGIYTRMSGNIEMVEFFQSPEGLIPFRYSFSPQIRIREFCETEHAVIRCVVQQGSPILELMDPGYGGFNDGYGYIKGDGIHYTESNKGSPDKPWGYPLGPLLPKRGCSYNKESHIITGDIEYLLQQYTRLI